MSTFRTGIPCEGSRYLLAALLKTYRSYHTSKSHLFSSTRATLTPAIHQLPEQYLDVQREHTILH